VLDTYGDEIIPLKADYLAERSIEDNIILESQQNAIFVVISYILMLFYVSIAIGFFPHPIHTKFGLGVTGITVVIGALVCAIGLTFYGNTKLTMISAEVVPFLILAIGVDNVFLICRAEREVPKFVTSVEQRMGFALKEIGPSIFTAALCEAIAFFIGLLTDVPALQNFCLVAGLAVVTDFFLQMTIFVGVLSLDNQRIRNNRADIICCCRKIKNPSEPRPEWVRAKFQKNFVPLLFKLPTMIGIISISVMLVIIGIMSLFGLKLGLNQNVSLVASSDTFDYFETLYVYG
jgi:Niemann-Pick C1 protein